MLVIPPWGCGTFGGDIRIKLLVLWIAASVCGRIREVRFTVRKSWWEGLDPEWRALINRMGDTNPNPRIVWEWLHDLQRDKMGSILWREYT